MSKFPWTVASWLMWRTSAKSTRTTPGRTSTNWPDRARRTASTTSGARKQKSQEQCSWYEKYEWRRLDDLQPNGLWLELWQQKVVWVFVLWTPPRDGGRANVWEVEFVVDDIKDIVWNPSSFDNLSIPAAKKKVITALAKAHMSCASDDVIDDFVEGKGQGLIMLLQYKIWRLVLYHKLTYSSSGPPGVGKTLTAEGLSEYLERPLYAVSLALRSSGRSDFSDICWGARPGREDTWRPTVYHLSPCSSLEGPRPSWWSRRVCAVTLFRQPT